jgi:hypothetical protein
MSCATSRSTRVLCLIAVEVCASRRQMSSQIRGRFFRLGQSAELLKFVERGRESVEDCLPARASAGDKTSI